MVDDDDDDDGTASLYSLVHLYSFLSCNVTPLFPRLLAPMQAQLIFVLDLIVDSLTYATKACASVHPSSPLTTSTMLIFGIPAAGQILSLHHRHTSMSGHPKVSVCACMYRSRQRSEDVLS